MAIDQEAQQRSITLPIQQVSAGNGLEQLGNATAKIGQLVTERISNVAITQAATKGEQDAESGNAPENLTMPLTKATKAYNDAVSRTEANRMVISAEQLINESLANSKNPATFNSNTPAAFKASLEGIKSGLLKNARPDQKAALTQKIDQMSAHAELNMLQHSIQFDNEQAQANLKHDITGLLEARRNASIAGDAERVSGIDAALDSSLKDYSTMNAGIERIAPYLRADIEKHKQVDAVLNGYSTALENKTTAQYMSNLAKNTENLPFNVWQDAVKGVVALDQTQKRLSNDINAEQWNQVQNGINNGSIQDASDVLNYDELTVPQQLTAMRQLDTLQAKQFKQGAQLITAQQNILSGRPSWNSGSDRDKMFEAAIQSQERQTGQPATLQEMSQSVLGQSNFPASGMPGTPMGTNVPAFDSVMTGQLTGKDPIQTATAAMVYNDMVNTQGQPNSVNLTGDALNVATLFNTLNKGGTSPDQAAYLAINTVLNATEPQIAARVDMFHKTLEKINPSTGKNQLQIKFKDAFGLQPQTFGSGEAFKFFSDTYRANYLASNSEESALKATKYAMRAWGTSQYFDKNYVGQPVPEKELPVVQVGNAFPNQIASNIQGLINRNEAARAAHPDLNLPVIEWANKDTKVTGTESEQDKVFGKFSKSSKPRIKINGQETDVVLMPSAESRLGNRINYLLGAYDQFNNLHPIKDPTNQVDGTARFMPQELATWAPSIATAQSDEAIKKAALKVVEKERQQDVADLQKRTPAWTVILGLASPAEYLEHVATSDKRETRLNEVIESLSGKSKLREAEEARDKIGEAENVGISANLEPKP